MSNPKPKIKQQDKEQTQEKIATAYKEGVDYYVSVETKAKEKGTNEKQNNSQ